MNFSPQHQKSDIFADLEKLSQHIPGKAYRFGDANEHHLFLFHLNKDFCPLPSDQTLEILMYEIQGEASHVFTEIPHHQGNIKKLFHNVQIFNGFEVDEHIFNPVGYSCNALKGDTYFTIHVTPQKISPYVSFETNINSALNELVNSVIQIFQPKSFDLVGFNPTTTTLCGVPQYQIINNIHQRINCGYYVGFSSYYQPPSAPKKALSLNLNSIQEDSNFSTN